MDPGRPSRSVSICATSQNAVAWPLNSRAALGMPRAIYMARTGAGLPELASARMNPASSSVRAPNLAGIAKVVRASSSPKVSAATTASAVDQSKQHHHHAGDHQPPVTSCYVHADSRSPLPTTCEDVG
jgi:cell pole-organizing protein PopZ